MLCINGVNAVFGKLLRLQLSKQQVNGNGLHINLVVALTCFVGENSGSSSQAAAAGWIDDLILNFEAELNYSVSCKVDGN